VPPESFDGFFNSRIPTASLVKMADQILGWQISTTDREAEKVTLQATRERLLTMQSMVNAETFRAANPLTPLGNVPRDAMVTTEEEIGKGGFGIVSSGIVTDSKEQMHTVAVKTPKADENPKQADKIRQGLVNEGQIGNNLTHVYAGINGETFFSDVQGLPLTVVPILLGNDVVIQEKVNGKDLSKVLHERGEPFKNGFVDDPQEAIRRAAGLVLALHALHCAGTVHHDLKPSNIMVEGNGNEIRFRLIDFGGTVAIGERYRVCSANGAPELVSPLLGATQSLIAQPSYDIYTLGTVLPLLFFGPGGSHLCNNFYGRKGTPSLFVQNMRRSKKDATLGIFRSFGATNYNMQKAIKKYYPRRVSDRLAAMTMDCLSMDPKERPTAEQVLLALQNMGFSDWRSEQYNIKGAPQPKPGSLEAQNNIEGVPQPEPSSLEAQTQRQFWWIWGEVPPPPPEVDVPPPPDRRK
jgi:serine/threonine protein kinase